VTLRPPRVQPPPCQVLLQSTQEGSCGLVIGEFFLDDDSFTPGRPHRAVPLSLYTTPRVSLEALLCGVSSAPSTPTAVPLSSSVHHPFEAVFFFLLLLLLRPPLCPSLRLFTPPSRHHCVVFPLLLQRPPCSSLRLYTTPRVLLEASLCAFAIHYPRRCQPHPRTRSELWSHVRTITVG